ncbi:MAG: hypothetical protein ABI813_15060 [Bacteroidota bacterium]
MKCLYGSCLVIGQLFCQILCCQVYLSDGNKTEPELLWELGGAAGAMNCLTDIGGHAGAGKKFIKDINWNQEQWCGSIFISATWHYLFALQLEAGLGRLSGSDLVPGNNTGSARNRYLRNLKFNTTMAELALLCEIYPLMITDRDRDLSLLSPYLIAGVGFFKYTPRAWLNNVWVDLRSLHTEGEGFKEYPSSKPYGPVAWCVPVGAGIKYDAGGLINLRFEILYRFTGTDYLDDASSRYIDPVLFGRYLSPAQSLLASRLADRSAEIVPGATHAANDLRGNPANRDAYFTCTLKASIVLGRVQRK